MKGAAEGLSVRDIVAFTRPLEDGEIDILLALERQEKITTRHADVYINALNNKFKLLNKNVSIAYLPNQGYRLVNQIFFKGQLDLDRQKMQVIQIIFLIVCLSGLLNGLISSVCNFCMVHMANLFGSILNLGIRFV